MDTVGITVDLARYRCMVHYTNCSYYKPTHTHANLEIPPSMKWRLCSHCKPEKEDIVTVAEDIKWLHKRADVFTFRGRNLFSFDDGMEEQMGRENLNGGKLIRRGLRHGDR